MIDGEVDVKDVSIMMIKTCSVAGLDFSMCGILEQVWWGRIFHNRSRLCHARPIPQSPGIWIRRPCVRGSFNRWYWNSHNFSYIWNAEQQVDLPLCISAWTRCHNTYHPSSIKQGMSYQHRETVFSMGVEKQWSHNWVCVKLWLKFFGNCLLNI